MNTKLPRRAEPVVPFDASNPEQVHDREKKAKLRADYIVEGMEYIMADARGRAYMRHLISQRLFTRVGAIRPAAIFTGNSTTFYNTALKELGDILTTELAAMVPGSFRLMEDEGATNA